MADGPRYNQDNVAIVVSFADGSLGNILYLANGDRSLPKESYEIFCEGAVARLDDYRSLELVRHGKSCRIRLDGDKGHKKELELTIRALREGSQAPIDFEELVEVTEASFSVLDSLRFSLPIKLRTYPMKQADQEDAPERL
jgi:polar amino acid transport system substrate-binding protein